MTTTGNANSLSPFIKQFFLIFLEADEEIATLVVGKCRHKQKRIAPLLEETLNEFLEKRRRSKNKDDDDGS